MKGGKITREYTSEEFNGLSEQARTEMGLRTFALEQLQPAANTAMHRDGTGAEAVPLCVSPTDRQSCTYRIVLFRPAAL